MKSKKILLLILLLAIILVGVFLYINSKQDNFSNLNNNVDDKITTFRTNNDKGNVELEYPQSWWHHKVNIESYSHAPGSKVDTVSLDSFGTGEYNQFNQPFTKDDTRIILGLDIFTPVDGNALEKAKNELLFYDEGPIEVTIGNYSAELYIIDDVMHEVESARMYVRDYYIINENLIYIISIAGRNQTAHNIHKKEINSILNSFKLINNNTNTLSNSNVKKINFNSNNNQNINTVPELPRDRATYNNFLWNFQLDYPLSWEITENNSEDGYEIVQLVREDPDVENSGHGGQDPNSAKLSVLFYLKNGMNFNDRINSLIPSENIVNSEENLSIDGLPAKSMEDEGLLGSTIRLFIDYNNEYLVLMNGYYGDGDEMNTLMDQIEEIQNSFRKI